MTEILSLAEGHQERAKPLPFPCSLHLIETFDASVVLFHDNTGSPCIIIAVSPDCIIISYTIALYDPARRLLELPFGNSGVMRNAFEWQSSPARILCAHQRWRTLTAHVGRNNLAHHHPTVVVIVVVDAPLGGGTIPMTHET